MTDGHAEPMTPPARPEADAGTEQQGDSRPTLVVSRRLLRGYGPLALVALALILMALLVPTKVGEQGGAQAPATRAIPTEQAT